ncbi:isoprenyl transferase [Undibacterium umbellatum]|jgi:undecaprenyl diphosphate synthase|uniref:Isoprenyl transferase n=1 Tax=Undibacterium umbellatum TaxID=2762300 RepID=A0ABR6Z3G7_9BURK|nr:isoprenyl transferase [Undibacterium umbellatum]MBC3906149.1 isoprenyl transferase [Undibacterium umbellatum]
MTHTSSTKEIPAVGAIPKHIAIIMDGNGRWATKRFLPRVAGHVKGVEAVRGMVEACAKRGVSYLTLFAFSSENWRRPAEEVSLLMRLFVTALEKEVAKMHANNIRLKVVGDLTRFDAHLQKMIIAAEEKTANNQGLTVTICANYGGRWDIIQAMNRLQKDRLIAGQAEQEVTEEQLAAYLSMAYAPEPDLFIRTGGETRISNFLLWQLAYSEFYFTDTFWPDFDAEALDISIQSYQNRERRFGRTSAQVTEQTSTQESK